MLLRLRQFVAEVPGKRCVLSVPHHQGAGLLKKHRLIELCQQLGPALETIHTHAHHIHFGDGRLSQGGEHGRGHPSSRALKLLRLCLMQLHMVALQAQAPSHQAPHQTGTQDNTMLTSHQACIRKRPCTSTH